MMPELLRLVAAQILSVLAFVLRLIVLPGLLRNQRRVFTSMLHHSKEGALLFYELVGVPLLYNLTSLHHNNFIIVSYCVQTMCYCYYCCVRKTFFENVLNEGVSLHVYVGSGFIQDKKLVATQQGPCKTYQLLLTD